MCLTDSSANIENVFPFHVNPEQYLEPPTQNTHLIPTYANFVSSRFRTNLQIKERIHSINVFICSALLVYAKQISTTFPEYFLFVALLITCLGMGYFLNEISSLIYVIENTTNSFIHKIVLRTSRMLRSFWLASRYKTDFYWIMQTLHEIFDHLEWHEIEIN